jgi:uncharacterized protein
LSRWLPDEEKLRSSRSLRWLGPLVRRPWLWQLTRRRVALGAAIGVFFGLLVPVMQIAASAAAAGLMRANLPVAAVATLVSNPLTYVPIWVAAYQTGGRLLGDPVEATQARSQAAALVERLDAPASDARGWSGRVLDIGKPLLLGLGVFAVAGAAVTWLLVNGLWILSVRLRQRRRRSAAAAR